jgi:TIR domain/Pentapeptide repeats (8 copies)
MTSEEYLAQLKQGVEVWNTWRGEHPKTRPLLLEADLRRADLHGADLRGVYLRGADLRGVYLRGADLQGAHLSRADLRGADLRGVALRRAYLSWVDLSGADLSDADLTRAHIGWTAFGNMDLSTVQGLDTVVHEGPSSVGIDTLYYSHGNILEVFLRGAGVPEEMITYMKSLVGRPFEFYSCFMSYSSQDQEFAEHLYADLQSQGVRCWFAPHDIRSGRKIHEQIERAIYIHERLLLILSTHSMLSPWVKTEIAKAREREAQEKTQVLFPVSLVSFESVRRWKCFDADRGIDSASEIREYFIPDFSNWQDNDAYQKAFQRLLRDLKADI